MLGVTISSSFMWLLLAIFGNLINNDMKLTRIMNGGDFMIPLLVVLGIIGVVMLLSKFLPDIFRAIPAFIGLIILAILIGSVAFIIYLFA